MVERKRNVLSSLKGGGFKDRIAGSKKRRLLEIGLIQDQNLKRFKEILPGW